MQLVASSTLPGDIESFSLAGLAPGTYFVKVYGLNGATNLYSLQANIAFEDELFYQAPAGSDLVLRQNTSASTLELFDTVANKVVASSDLASTHYVAILGSTAADTHLSIDFQSGGEFFLRDGILFQGMASPSLSGTDNSITIKHDTGTDYTLTDSSLTGADGLSVALVNVTKANLVDTVGGHTFNLDGWSGDGSLTDTNTTAGATPDTVTVSKASDFTLTDTGLTTPADNMSVTLGNVRVAQLTDTGGGHSFSVGGWTGTGGLTSVGGNDTVTATKAANFTLSDSTLNADDGMRLTLTPGSFGTAALTEVGGGHRFTLNTATDSWTGSGRLVGTRGNDTVTVAKNAGFVLADATLNVTQSPTDHMAVGLAGIGNAELTDTGGQHAFEVSDWTGSGSLTGTGDLSDTVTARKDADFTLSDTLLHTSDNMTLNLAGVGIANLTGGPSPNRFDVGGWTGTGLIDGQGGDDTVTASDNANFTLTNTSLDRTGAGTLNLESIETALLTDTGGNHTLDIGSWTGDGTLTGDAAGSDTVKAVKDATRVVLTDASLGASDGMSLNLNNLRNAKLAGGPSPNVYDVSHWTGTGSLTGANANDTVTATKAASFTLSDTALDTSEGMQMALNGIGMADLSETGGGHVFTVDQWSGGGSLTGTGGNDTVAKSRDVSFTLTDDDLKTTDGMDMALAGIGTANLTGGPSANTFDVGRWTGNGSLTGGGGRDTVVATKDANFTLGNRELKTTDHMDLVLAGLSVADLTGGPGNNVFNVSKWMGTGKLDGEGGADTVVAAKDGNFTLVDSRLVTSDGMSLALEHLTAADLSGGAGDNIFDVGGWTGIGAIDGGSGGSDTVVATRDANFSLTDASLNDSDGMAFALAHIGTAALTGGADPDHFTVSNWTGNAVLNGVNGGDTYTINLLGSGSGTTTVNGNGGSSGGLLQVVGTPGGDAIAVTETQVTRGSEVVNYRGVLHQQVLGSAGTNSIRVSVTPTSAYNLLVDAGPSPGNTVTIADDAGGAVLHNRPASDTAGTAEVRYLQGAISYIAFAHADHLILTPDADHSFAQALYHDLMGRSGTPAEIEHWVAVLRRRHRGAPAKWRKVVLRLEQAPETRRHTVQLWYEEYFGQAAVGKELARPAAMLRDHTEEQVLATILGTHDYFMHSGGSRTGFVQSLVENLLARPATTAQLHRLKRLLTTTSRQDVAQRLLQSPEYRTDAFMAIYRTAFHEPQGQGFGPAPVQVNQVLARHLDQRSLRELLEGGLNFYVRG
jgi:hypothetical protein